MPLCCPDNSETLSGCFRNGCPDAAEICTVLEIETDMGARETIKFIADRMKSYEQYKDKIIQKDRCVRVNYAGDFHLDIVPAKPSGSNGCILIPCKSEDKWVETNPAGFALWCMSIDQTSDGRFSDVTKIVKYWRDNRVGKNTAPKSITLTTMLGHCFVGGTSLAESLVLTLENLLANYDNYQKDEEPYVDNPSLQGENLARDWDSVAFERFRSKLQRFTEKCRAALDELDDEETSIELWQEALGEQFPAELSEAASMAALGAVFVNRHGHVNRHHDGFASPPHRFHGDNADD